MTRPPILPLALLLTASLVACRGPDAPSAAGAQPPAVAAVQSVERVSIDSSSVQSSFTAKPGVQVLAWHPEAGFALLGRSGGALGALAVGGEANSNRFLSPEVRGSGVRAGGRGLWAGGRGLWAGGDGGNGSGNDNGLNGEAALAANSASWKQIDLSGARGLARKLGAGVKVAVIDTGVDLNHPAFVVHLAPANQWKDFVDGDAVPQEMDASGLAYGHGTGVANVILQVAPQATILPIRVLRPDGAGDVSALVQAVEWAMKQGARVINLSLGSDTPSPALDSMLSVAAARGVLIVASSGNDNSTSITYPAADDRAKTNTGTYLVSVGSVAANDAKSSFSNYGTLDLMAPGERVYTAYPGNGVSYWSGTSFAAPMVAGALALALAEGTDPAKASAKLSESADDIYKVNSKSWDKMLGRGRLDAREFLKKLSVK